MMPFRIGYADLKRGAQVAPVLDAMQADSLGSASTGMPVPSRSARKSSPRRGPP